MEPIKPNGAQGIALPAQAIPECDRCAARSPGISATLGNTALASPVAMTGQRHWAKRQILYDSNVEADAIYRITKGIVAEYKGFADGRRQIVAIRTVGDICGHPIRKGRYVFTGQAITPVEASAFGAEQFRATMERENAFACDVADEVSERLNQALIRLTVVGQFCALEGVAYFILDMQKRLPSCSIHVGTLALHLTRQEIADYLGLTLETVSRAFSKLRDMRLIALCSADVVTILDQKRLCEVASGRL
jgi:CRP-like cAMP-binding protein